MKSLGKQTRLALLRYARLKTRWPAEIFYPFTPLDLRDGGKGLTDRPMPVDDSEPSVIGITHPNVDGSPPMSATQPGAFSALATLQRHLTPADEDETEVARSAEFYAAHSRAQGTINRRNSNWMLVLDLCAFWRREPLPMTPQTAAYIATHLADLGYVFSSIRNVMGTIRTAHRISDHPNPTDNEVFRTVFDGIARVIGKEPKQQKKALVAEHLLAIGIAARNRPRIKGTVEWCVILTTYYGSFRCEELVSLDITDVRVAADGIHFDMNKSKTNQYGELERAFIPRLENDNPLCGAAALERWLELLDDPSGPLFRAIDGSGKISNRRMSYKTVSRIVKRYAETVGMHEDDLASTSIRAGIVTQMAMDGFSDVQIALITRRRSLESLQIYYRPGPDSAHSSVPLNG
jgi:hypothetical protein